MTPERRPRRLVLGLDVGGTKLAAGVLDAGAGTAELLAFEQAPARAQDGPDAMIERLVELGRKALAASQGEGDELVAVGVGCGGPLDPATGVVAGPMNLPGWDRVPLGERLAEAFGRPVGVENDATAATLGESRFGAGRGVHDLVYLTISTGIGGGVISGGRLLRGASGNAGELGHLTIDVDGRRCACGRRGCLEAIASGTNTAARAREAIEAGEPSVLPELAGGVEAVTAATVVEGVRRGDALATRIWRETTTAIGLGVADAINAFDPALVVLGGGVAGAGELLLVPVRQVAREAALRAPGREVRIVATALGERLGVVGAAAVALDRFGIRADESSTVSALAEHAAAVAGLEPLVPQIDAVGAVLVEALGCGGKLIAFGNGGSAADAQHLVAELVGHFRRERRPLPALALTTDPSVVTAIANDYSFADVFARQVEANAKAGDIVIGISTSGEAENVVRGLEAARRAGATTVALTGGNGGRIAALADHALVMPAARTAPIQELHVFVVHALSEHVDAWVDSVESQAAR